MNKNILKITTILCSLSMLPQTLLASGFPASGDNKNKSGSLNNDRAISVTINANQENGVSKEVKITGNEGTFTSSSSDGTTEKTITSKTNETSYEFNNSVDAVNQAASAEVISPPEENYSGKRFR